MFHMSNKLIFKQKIQDENALVTEENFGSWTTLLNQVNLNRIISKSTAMLYTFMCCGVLFFFAILLYCDFFLFSDSYWKNGFILWTFRVVNGFQEQIKFVNWGSTVCVCVYFCVCLMKQFYQLSYKIRSLWPKHIINTFHICHILIYLYFIKRASFCQHWDRFK